MTFLGEHLPKHRKLQSNISGAFYYGAKGQNFYRLGLRKIALLCRQRFNYFIIFSIFNPARVANLVCLSSNVRNRSALINKAEAT